MQDIIKEYGPAILTVVSIVALVGLITVLINGVDGNGGVVQSAFTNLINDFFDNTTNIAGIGQV